MDHFVWSSLFFNLFMVFQQLGRFSILRSKFLDFFEIFFVFGINAAQGA